MGSVVHAHFTICQPKSRKSAPLDKMHLLGCDRLVFQVWSDRLKKTGESVRWFPCHEVVPGEVNERSVWCGGQRSSASTLLAMAEADLSARLKLPHHPTIVLIGESTFTGEVA